MDYWDLSVTPVLGGYRLPTLRCGAFPQVKPYFGASFPRNFGAYFGFSCLRALRDCGRCHNSYRYRRESRPHATDEARDVLTARHGAYLAGGTAWRASAGRPRRCVVSVLTMQQTEFRWVFPRWQPPPGNGLVAIVSRAEATRGWVNSLLAIDGDRQWVWAGLGGEPEDRALEIVDRFGVAMASLAAAGTDVRRVCLTLQVAGWLSRQRAGAGDAESRPARSCLTCCSAPAPPPGAVRVPHLVSVRHGGWVKDAVVWELMDATFARQWLGLPPGWEFFESHLRRLLWLRAAVRVGRLPATPLARRLVQLIYACDADLSIEMVYRNDDLFRLLLEAWEGVPFRDFGGDDAA